MAAGVVGPFGSGAGAGDWKAGTPAGPAGSIAGVPPCGAVMAWLGAVLVPQPPSIAQPSDGQHIPGGGPHIHGGGGGGQHIGPWLLNESGQQPSAVIDPKMLGVKALYGLQQIVAEPWQQWWQNSQAEACPVLRPTPARLRTAANSSFFMA
jgi:hypothetical protein